MKEIGKVKLDYRYYPGEDLYSDGEIEEKLLSIVQNYSPDEFPKVIEESNSWPILYHLSPLRSNSIEWLPISKESKVLEIGAGCGAITGMLAEKAAQVVCVELSDRRSRINAYRHQDKDNIYIHVGNFKEIETILPEDFDFILLVGVFEYSCLYMETGTPYEDMLRRMQKHLKPEGRLVIAIENKLGMKYWAGCTEDHLGTYFSGIEGYQEGGSARTFTRKGLERIMKACEVQDFTFYYPYPDYKFMTTLYSDRRLPRKGELTDNNRNFDRDRLLLFNEKYAFDGMIEDGLFPEFSNSYLVVIGKAPETLYAKYSNDRSAAYAIRTDIIDLWQDNGKAHLSGGDRLEVRKTALNRKAIPHVLQMEETYHLLCKRYEGSTLAINRCRKGQDDKSVIFEYLEGSTLEEQMNHMLAQGDRAGFDALFDRFLAYVSYGQAEGKTNYDFIFSNLMIGEKDKGLWTLIDYEWMMEKELPSSEIAFRAIHCFLLEEEKRNQLNLPLLIEKIGISQEEAERYKENEKKFQKMVTGKRMAMGDIWAASDTCSIDPRHLLQRYKEQTGERRVQIYYDRGKGFSEEESHYLKDSYLSPHEIRVDLILESDVLALRLDPANQACVLRIRSLRWNGRELSQKKHILLNGREIKEGIYLFMTEDPGITLPVGQWEQQWKNRLEITMEIGEMPLSLAEGMADSVKKHGKR